MKARGGEPVRLPGMRLAAAEDVVRVRKALAPGSGIDTWIFTSPAAVEYFLQLVPRGRLSAANRVLAVGGGTARALARRGIASLAPARLQNSEGLLEEPVLADPRGLVDRHHRCTGWPRPAGAGACASAAPRSNASPSISVCRRVWTARHLQSLERAPRPWLSLLSSSLALRNLLAALPGALIERWRREALIVSSERLAESRPRARGFVDVHEAPSALASDLLDSRVPCWPGIGCKLTLPQARTSSASMSAMETENPAKLPAPGSRDKGKQEAAASGRGRLAGMSYVGCRAC